MFSQGGLEFEGTFVNFSLGHALSFRNMETFPANFLRVFCHDPLVRKRLLNHSANQWCMNIQPSVLFQWYLLKCQINITEGEYRYLYNLVDDVSIKNGVAKLQFVILPPERPMLRDLIFRPSLTRSSTNVLRTGTLSQLNLQNKTAAWIHLFSGMTAAEVGSCFPLLAWTLRWEKELF